MVQAENKSEHKLPPIEHTSAKTQTTTDKFSSILNNRTLRDITQMLYPYKRNPTDFPITTLTHLIHCYACTKPELVGHRPHFLVGVGGTGIRWDIISGTSFYT